MRQRCVEWIGVSIFVVLVGAMAPIRIAAQTDQLPSPWVGADIGFPSPAGSASFDSGSFAISAGGADIWDTYDQFHFVYQQVAGDVDILASVDSLSAADPWSKIGVIIRCDRAPDAAIGFATVTGAMGLAFQSRPMPGGTSDSTAGEPAAAPRWVRLTRVGATVTGYSSVDGASWLMMGSTTVALGDSAYVGIAMTSHNSDATAQATVSQVQVFPLSLPNGQRSADIGNPPIPGSTAYRQGVYTITASGADIWSAWDQFRFVFQPVTGDVDIVARVASVVDGDSWAKAGVMIRESLAPDARNTMAVMSAQQGYLFQWRLDPGGLADGVWGGGGTAPAWLRLVRIGSNIEAFKSADGSNWTSMGAEVVPMADAVYVGLAVTSHSTTQTTTAVIDHLTITQPGVYQPPTVTLTSPTPGAQFVAPANIVVSADAADPQNQLTLVEFYANATRIGSLTAPPFTMTWAAVPAGTYSLTAVASDGVGLSTTSDPVTITVTSGSNPPRFAVFQASADHATLVTNYWLDIFSDGSDPNTATPLASSDLGKPTPDASGVITADCAAFFGALAPGTYIATVSAVGSGGEGRSAPVTFVR
jgi:regulation of enolase protein 1 (concanavalin A-like superfamily)